MSEIAASLAAFCDLLRRSGVGVGPAESADALMALTHLDVGSREAVYLGLRAVLVKRADSYEVYDAAFRAFFDGEVPQVAVVATGETEVSGGGGGYSPREALLEEDLAALAAGAELERAAAWAARQLALKLSRRRRSVSHGGSRLDLRATVRRALRQSGQVERLLHSRRRRQPGNLVLLVDVSRSMAPYSQMLLRFASALAAGFRRADAFWFATGLSRAETEPLRGGGGTRIGTALTQFCDQHETTLLRSSSAVVILSDGLDTGEPELVAAAMARIRRRAGRVIWLNPLAGDDRYQPLARAMQAALPYVDILAPGHSLNSLLALGRHLAAGRRR